MTGYVAAPEVERIAEQLIDEHHHHKVSGLPAHLVHLVRKDEPPEEVDFFVIEIAANTWRTLTDEQKVALVDHELCHCITEIPETVDKDRKLVIRGHDLEEFAAVVRQHGLWRPDIEAFMANSAQPTLHEAMGEG